MFKRFLCLFVGLLPFLVHSTDIGSYYIPQLVIDEHNGLFIKMHNEVMQRANIDAKLLIQPTKRTQASFNAGYIDAYFPELYENLPNETVITSQPFFLKRIVLFTRKGSNIKTLKDLQGKIVGAVTGYSYGKKIINNSKIYFSYAKDDNANIERLMRGYIDAVIGDDASTVAAVNNSPHVNQVEYAVHKPIHILDVFYVCQNNKKGKSLCDAINIALKAMKKEGIIKLEKKTGSAQIQL
ncbi:substrate-binding periplasmic protein [Litorilituus lipolyticus]|uniref:Transporter substrate-binding domain-containing protein n=1 Tax=Litorilituus lipolyticus TaxID=2491017 RepID=A0A502KZN7_9GAMM|nr:transporter substrate-binding domain-containing protein [Litorilituus lipolyticus]TPH16514.1 transporter substrate-binding domain-containing protein [Litorilituus lipolyticus]